MNAAIERDELERRYQGRRQPQDASCHLIWQEGAAELWVGNKEASQTFTGNVLCVLEYPHCWRADGTTHIHIMYDNMALRSQLDAAAEFITQHMKVGSRLLVHCAAGMERSPLTVAWWLVKTGRCPDLDAAYVTLRAARPIVADRRNWIEPDIQPKELEELTEQGKYELMWKYPQYRRVAPGAQVAEQFLRLAQPRTGSTVIDFGAGTGQGAMCMALAADLLYRQPVKVHMLDFARNCLDDEVRDAVAAQPLLEFTQHDLTKPAPLSAPYGFCTDVMEHIPPDQVDLVLQNILAAAQHVFFQISCTDDSCGTLIGEKLHLSVHPPAWWKEKLEKFQCVFHYWHAADDGSTCIAYVSAWADGQEVVDKGELNTEEETIRANVRANLLAGWKQVRPYEPQHTEVMILGGGPSLNGQLDTIRRMSAEGVKIVTLNGAYNWALEHGLQVGSQVVVDARPFNARFTKPVDPKTNYLIGSQCDPSVLEGLPKERTFLWHTTAEAIRDILVELSPDDAQGRPTWFGIPGGTTVLLRAIPLLKMLGYRKFHLFGCDSCVVHKDTCSDDNSDFWNHHAYQQVENDGVPLYPAVVGGRTFRCTAWQIAQAQEFISLIKHMGNMFELEVYGDGLLRWILQHGADMCDEMDAHRTDEALGIETPGAPWGM